MSREATKKKLASLWWRNQTLDPPKEPPEYKEWRAELEAKRKAKQKKAKTA